MDKVVLRKSWRNTWRDRARPIIESIIAENQDRTHEELKKILSKRYPWGERKYYPYKIWLDECKIQLGIKIVKDKTIHKKQMRLF